MDDFTAIAITSSGTWQSDDSNQENYPIIRTDIVSGQRDYPFTTDETNNLILDVYKVIVYDSNGNGRELLPVDAQSTSANGNDIIDDFYNGQNLAGVPTRYDKTANAIFLDYIPNYTTNGEVTGIYGLEVYINRESSYFTFTDTNKMPGVPGIFHKYFYLKPALDYARRKSAANLTRLQEEVMKMEGDELRRIKGTIAQYFGQRERDIKRGLRINNYNER